MRTVSKAWVQDLGRDWSGHSFAVSTERHDGIVYTARSAEEAVRCCKVDEIVIA